MPVKCKYCEKEFKYPYLLRRHLNGVRPCLKEKLICEKCGREFNRTDSFKRHLNMKTDCRRFLTIYPPTDKSEYMEKVLGTKNSMKNSQNTMTNSQNNTVNTVNSNNTNVTINNNFHLGADKIVPFNRMNYDFIMNNIIDREGMLRMLKNQGMPVMMFRQGNLNPKFPKGHNVNIKNIKAGTMNVKEKDGWKVKDYKEFLRDFINNLQNILQIFETVNEEEDTPLSDYFKAKIKDLDYKFSHFYDNDNDKTLPDVKMWFNRIKQEMIDCSEMLKNSMRKDTRKSKKKKKIEGTDEPQALEGYIEEEDIKEDGYSHAGSIDSATLFDLTVPPPGVDPKDWINPDDFDSDEDSDSDYELTPEALEKIKAYEESFNKKEALFKAGIEADKERARKAEEAKKAYQNKLIDNPEIKTKEI